MKKRELLTYILGYLYGINSKKKIPINKLQIINDFIMEFNTITNNEANYLIEKHESSIHEDLMEGFDYDSDNDQQNPNIW